MYAVKQYRGVWGYYYSDSIKVEKTGDISMLVVEDVSVIYDSLFALMANTEDEIEIEITLFDIKKNLDNYSARKIKSLASVSFHSYVN